MIFANNFNASVSEPITYGLICQPITVMWVILGFYALSSDCVIAGVVVGWLNREGGDSGGGAKNYLSKDEIDTLNRLVTIFLESAELRAKNRIDITLDFWRENVDKILDFHDKKILSHAGSISKAEMENIVREIYTDFDKRRKEYEALKADEEDLRELKQIENEIKKLKK